MQRQIAINIKRKSRGFTPYCWIKKRVFNVLQTMRNRNRNQLANNKIQIQNQVGY